MLLQIDGLHKYYGGVHALDGVSFSMEEGTVTGLVGGNGAGKSTLMRCVTGADIADSGSIIFDGRVLTQGDPHDSRKAGIEMIYQTLDLCDQQDVVSNIFLGRETGINLLGMATPFLDRKTMKEKAMAVIRQLNADIDVGKRAGELSGGQRQAVAIARALLYQPRLLIMDEPTAALGIRESAKVLGLIAALKQKGMAIILVTHKLTDLLDVADRVVLMRHGKIEEDRPVSETSLPELTQKIMVPA